MFDPPVRTWEAFAAGVLNGRFRFGEPGEFIFRGHGESRWKLEPTFDRIVKSNASSWHQKHLKEFKEEIRGRRGPHPVSLESENDWWALGQHYGLATPLLDWTESPFVALYFAALGALEIQERKDSAERQNATGMMAIYALDARLLETAIRRVPQNPIFDPVVIVRPSIDENARLLSQRGLFTRGPSNVPMEDWIKNFSKTTSVFGERAVTEGLPESLSLFEKFELETHDLQNCLEYLETMNISHATLFPDLMGAAELCNRRLGRFNRKLERPLRREQP